MRDCRLSIADCRLRSPRSVIPSAAKDLAPQSRARSFAALRMTASGVCRAAPATLAILTFIAGCASAVSSGHNTALDGTDLVQMTDDMAAKMVADLQVQSA